MGILRKMDCITGTAYATTLLPPITKEVIDTKKNMQYAADELTCNRSRKEGWMAWAMSR